VLEKCEKCSLVGGRTAARSAFALSWVAVEERLVTAALISE
jgi:hypothetical protein